jgi:CDP-diacylglycerol--glycerol-3-phosphate 3-phosphatidyltransferase
LKHQPADQSGAPERITEGLRFFTLPNALSILRIVLLVPILILIDRPDQASRVAGVALLFVAGITDLLDGALARWRGWISPSGKIVDPIADKVLIGGLAIYLALTRGFPIWLLVFIVFRDLALVAGTMLFLKRDRLVFQANWTGKVTTFALSLLVLAYVLDGQRFYRALTVLALIALGLSTFSYGKRALMYRGRS